MCPGSILGFICLLLSETASPSKSFCNPTRWMLSMDAQKNCKSWRSMKWKMVSCITEMTMNHGWWQFSTRFVAGRWSSSSGLLSSIPGIYHMKISFTARDWAALNSLRQDTYRSFRAPLLFVRRVHAIRALPPGSIRDEAYYVAMCRPWGQPGGSLQLAQHVIVQIHVSMCVHFLDGLNLEAVCLQSRLGPPRLYQILAWMISCAGEPWILSPNNMTVPNPPQRFFSKEFAQDQPCSIFQRLHTFAVDLGKTVGLHAQHTFLSTLWMCLSKFLVFKLKHSGFPCRLEIWPQEQSRDVLRCPAHCVATVPAPY